MTIKFNVGGKHFEISKDALNKNPDSTLVQLMKDSSLKQPIFIDRNGDVFSLVLDYIRYSNVCLPISVPKETFLRELDHYKIIYQDGTVTHDTLGGQCSSAYDDNVENASLPHKIAEHQEQIDCIRAQTELLDLTNKMEYLANHCFQIYVQDYKTGLTILPIFVILDVDSSDHEEVFAAAKMLRDDQALTVLQNAMLKYQLELERSRRRKIFRRIECC